jgi:hypothetical protein
MFSGIPSLLEKKLMLIQILSEFVFGDHSPGYEGVEPFVFKWAKKIYVLLNEFLSKFHFLLVWLIDSGLFR